MPDFIFFHVTLPRQRRRCPPPNNSLNPLSSMERTFFFCVRSPYLTTPIGAGQLWKRDRMS
ncbi:hypothetical protein M407DRAFT_247216 [Tulasnella calospora MUT 4182]|uniref:Uncharacterized protein n=1 Tax=Tulasnella calospora MUT 4182 TaxID=1051891 RepID=A0A0C3K251_9AGAM|nr:hypothetical protein M407DRAFT_247216 [Tulasnella calospora MUT 4182]